MKKKGSKRAIQLVQPPREPFDLSAALSSEQENVFRRLVELSKQPGITGATACKELRNWFKEAPKAAAAKVPIRFNPIGEDDKDEEQAVSAG